MHYSPFSSILACCVVCQLICCIATLHYSMNYIFIWMYISLLKSNARFTYLKSTTAATATSFFSVSAAQTHMSRSCATAMRSRLLIITREVVMFFIVVVVARSNRRGVHFGDTHFFDSWWQKGKCQSISKSYSSVSSAAQSHRCLSVGSRALFCLQLPSNNATSCK